jgi:hypothetical protein
LHDEVPASETATEPKLESEVDGHFDDDADELFVTDSQISWTLPLRLCHQLDGRLPLPGQIAGAMRGGAARLRLMLTHDGYELDQAQAHQDTETELYVPLSQLSSIEWPLEFFPGIILTCTWPRGSGTVRATSTLLDVPVTVDGMVIEHRYDKGILTRETAPGEGRRSAGAHGDSSTGRAGTLTLVERVLRAVRRRGLLDPDGRAVLARSSLPEAVYGTKDNTEATDEALTEVVDRLVQDGDLSLDVASVDTTRRLRFPADHGQRTVDVLVYQPSIVTAPLRSMRVPLRQAFDVQFLRTVDVAGHLRRIEHLGWVASPSARAAYREDRLRYRLAGPDELPPGFTYVPSFTRGG